MKTLSSLSLLLVLLIAAGCSSSPVNTIDKKNPNATPTIVDSRVNIYDNNLAKRLSLVSVNEAQVGDLLQVQVTFQNVQVKPRTFAYQFQWVQQNGMVVTSPTPVWTPSHVEGGQTVSVSAVAPKPSVVDFRISLREID
tara:strand:+ start:29848 stop:30264 length:417 start_codon:yes stop_codon:yes gene_type:complete